MYFIDKQKIRFFLGMFFMIWGIVFSSEAKAALLDPVDLLGQVDGVGDPIWTGNAPNNGSFSKTKGVVFDEINHRMFVAAEYVVLVYNLNSSNQLVDNKPDYVLGSASLNNAPGSGGVTQNSFNSELGSLAYDTAGQRLFVSDIVNNRVLVFDVASIQNGENAINVLGQADFISSIMQVSPSGMNGPRGLAYDDARKRLYVADSGNNRVLVFDVATLNDGQAAISVLGQTDMFSQFSSNTANGMYLPFGLWFDNMHDRLFVACAGQSRVLVFAGANISTNANANNVIGQPDFTTTSSGVSQSLFSDYSPTGITGSESGNKLFVADTNNSRVLVFDISLITDGMSATVVLGQVDFVSNFNNYQITNKLNNVDTLAFNQSTQNLFAGTAYETRLNVYNANSLSNDMDPTDYVFPADPEGFYSDSSYMGNALVVDAKNHRLFVSDKMNHRILVFDLDADNKPLDRQADYVLGQSDLYSAKYEGVNAHSLYYPRALAYENERDYLFVADADHANRILVFDVSSITNGEDAIHVLGQADFTSYATDVNANVTGDNDGGMAYDSEHKRLFYGDWDNSRVMVFDVTNIQNGEAAVNVLGQPDFSSGTPVVSQTGLGWDISGLEYDRVNQRLFVADSANRIVVYDVNQITNGEPAIAVLGQNTFDTSDSGIGRNMMDTPKSAAFDPNTGYLYVNDFNNHRIMVFDANELTNGEDAINVIGQVDFDGTTSSSAKNRFDNPTGIEIDPTTNQLLVYERDNNRIEFIQLPTVQIDELSAVPNEAYSQNFTAIGGTAPYVYTLASGTLPAGIALSSDGKLSGKPTAEGTYTFTVAIEDSTATAPAVAGLKGAKQIILTVGTNNVMPPVVPPVALPIESPVVPGIQEEKCDLNADIYKIANIAENSLDLKVEVDCLKNEKADFKVEVKNLETGEEDTLKITENVSAERKSALTITALQEATKYRFRVRYSDKNENEYSDWSSKEDATTLTSVEKEEIVQAKDETDWGNYGKVTTETSSNAESQTIQTEVSSKEQLTAQAQVEIAKEVASKDEESKSGGDDKPKQTLVGKKIVDKVAVIKSVDEFVNTPVGENVAEAAVAAGAAAAVAVSAAATASTSTGFSVLRNLAMGAVAFRRKKQWGTVFDFKTKAPVDYAQVFIMDPLGNVLDRTVTDKNGRFGFLVSKGEYQLGVKKESFTFPAKLPEVKTEDEIYGKIYAGGLVHLEEDGVLQINIPVDADFDLRELAEKRIYRLTSVSGLIFKYFSNSLFWGGFLLTLFVQLFNPSKLNLAFLLTYLLIIGYKLFSRKTKYGTLMDLESKKPIPFAKVNIYDKNNQKKGFVVTDMLGRYYELLDNGEYILDIAGITRDKRVVQAKKMIRIDDKVLNERLFA